MVDFEINFREVMNLSVCWCLKSILQWVAYCDEHISIFIYSVWPVQLVFSLVLRSQKTLQSGIREIQLAVVGTVFNGNSAFDSSYLLKNYGGSRHKASNSLKPVSCRRSQCQVSSKSIYWMKPLLLVWWGKVVTGEKPSLSLFGSSNLDREWEIVGVDEICRRLSLDQVDQVVLPLPEGATSSQILDESMSRQVNWS